ncbi:MAG: helix-turn-helix domain-containing protein [Planctomycetota bacterium]
MNDTLSSEDYSTHSTSREIIEPISPSSSKRSGNGSLQPVKRKRNAGPDDLYSPRKVAAAIGVSESSLKRWCDAGYVRATKTAGGHRRVARSEVIAFLKRKKYDLRDPTAIGLPDIRSVEISDDQDAIKQLAEALQNGDENACRKLLVYLYVGGRTVPDLFDRIIRPAFEGIGELWQCGQLDIYKERLACQISYAAALDIRSLIPVARAGAPLAIGCTLEGDHYQLATLGVEMSLSTFGWRATSLGCNIPIDSLFRAYEQQMPQLVWISVSHIPNPDTFVSQLNQFTARVNNRASVVLGGRQLSPEIRDQISGATCCDNFAQLILAAQNLSNRLR